MRKRDIDNFKQWREDAKQKGLIKATYPTLERNGNLAELIGVVLGDGHLYKHDRCDSLRITGNTYNIGFTSRYTRLIKSVFGKEPAVLKVKATRAVTITIYEKHIHSRLGIPYGNRAQLKYMLPTWIQRKREYKIRFLRGLYEAEGSLSYHAPTYTHKLAFANRNQELLLLVANLISELGFKTSVSACQVQVSRKAEVQKLKDLIQFRNYDL